MRRLIIDADSIIYKNAATLEKELPVFAEEDFDESQLPQFVHLSVDPAEVHDAFWLEIEDIGNRMRADVTEVTITDSLKNFRLDVDPTYKGNRVHTRKPLAVKTVRDWLMNEENVHYKPTLEADDVCGILATLPQHRKDTNIIWSIDKDLLGVPGLHIGHSPTPNKVIHMDEEAARRFHLLQTAAGDVTDGYPGIKGVGMKTAEKWFDANGWDWGSMMALADEKIRGNFESLEDLEEFMIRQGRLAKMLTVDWYDFKKKEPILWTPHI